MKLKQRTERKLIKLSEIKLDESNPNKLNEKKTAALSKSLERFGYVDEIVIDKKTRVIADGEHRYKELEKLGIKEVEVKIIDFENDAERRLYRQITAKVHGEHQVDLDAAEFKKILEETDLEDFTASIGDSEQEILNIINSLEKEEKIPDDSTEVDDRLYHIEIECPFCKKKFKKKKDLNS